MSTWQTFHTEEREVEELPGTVVLEYQRHYEDMPVRGNLVVSDEPEKDKETEDRALEELEGGNPYAWCGIQVIAYLKEVPEVRAGADLWGISILEEWAKEEHGGLEEAAIALAKDGHRMAEHAIHGCTWSNGKGESHRSPGLVDKVKELRGVLCGGA